MYCPEKIKTSEHLAYSHLRFLSWPSSLRSSSGIQLARRNGTEVWVPTLSLPWYPNETRMLHQIHTWFSSGFVFHTDMSDINIGFNYPLSNLETFPNFLSIFPKLILFFFYHNFIASYHYLKNLQRHPNLPLNFSFLFQIYISICW